MESKQASIGEAVSAKTDTISITRTIVCRLESSNKKNEKLRTGVKEFQAITEYMAGMLPSFPEHEWTSQNNQFYRMVRREFSDSTVSAACSRNAAQKVASTFKAWREKGKPGERPQGEFGNGDYLQLSNQEYDIVENDRGYGLKARFIPYEPVWWHLNIGEHQRSYIERGFGEDGRFGSAELFYNDGEPFVNLTVAWDRPVYKPETVQHVVGVDLGERVLWAAAVRDAESGEVADVEMERGAEFRHYRDRLDRKKAELQEKGHLRAVKQLRGERERYTDHVTHTASKRIVELARDHAPALIRLEELTHYREQAKEPIHDWPFAQLQEKIAYKAEQAGIPVEQVDAAYTSQTCRKCGHRDDEQRDGDEFYCLNCGYDLHADVNAAMNIAAAD
jgi:IS605 OrfB family transposase